MNACGKLRNSTLLFGISTTIFMAALILILGGSGIVQAAIVIDPDAFPDGSDISNAFAGVTLSSVGPYTGLDGRVYARTAIDSAYASTGTKVFGNNLSGTDSAGSPRSEVWYRSSSNAYRLRADFDGLANYVAIDIIGNNGSDYGVLEVYNSVGTLLTYVNTPELTTGGCYTAQINRAFPDIAYIIASGTDGDTVYLDHLVYVPEPATVLLLGVGGLALIRRRRR